MKLAFIIYHPVEAHLYTTIFRNLNKNYEVIFIIIEKENIETELIKDYDYPFISIHKLKGGILSNFLNIPLVLFFLLKTFIKNPPDLIVSATSPYIGIVSKLLHIKSIGWTDTETASFNNKLAFPFFNSLLIPASFYKKVFSKRAIYFDSYKEIAYLHPQYFKPNVSVIEKMGLNTQDKIVLMRFSALHAFHDIGLNSEIEKNKYYILHIIEEISKHAKVFISYTEKELPVEFIKYSLDIHPSEYLHFLAFCSLYIGEGTTTASEAGVLGIPWIALRSLRLGYLEDQEMNFELGIRTDNLELALNKALEWLDYDNLKEIWQKKRDKLLSSKISFTDFLVWFIENYPESHNTMKLNPEYQNRFLKV